MLLTDKKPATNDPLPASENPKDLYGEVDLNQKSKKQLIVMLFALNQ